MSHKGYQSIQISTGDAEYFYHKPGGGFATLLDKTITTGSAGTRPQAARAISAAFPTWCTPTMAATSTLVANNATTTALSDGALKATFKSASKPNGDWEVRWDVFPITRA